MREMLIELYREAHKKAHEHCNNVRCDKCEYEHFGGNCIRIAKADHLIANGVTIPVRCKDCKHFDEYTSKCYVFCHDNIEVQLEVDSDHFCSYGERRTDERTD